MKKRENKVQEKNKTKSRQEKIKELIELLKKETEQEIETIENVNDLFSQA